MLSLLLDLESLYGLPDGLIPAEALTRCYGHDVVGTAIRSGLIRRYACNAFDKAGCGCRNRSGAIGLTKRGRMLAAHPAGAVHPIELAAEPHEIVSAVLGGAQI